MIGLFVRLMKQVLRDTPYHALSIYLGRLPSSQVRVEGQYTQMARSSTALLD